MAGHSSTLKVPELFTTVTIAAIAAVLMAVTIMHGLLKPVLVARGVSPWRLLDSLLARPLVIAGSAGVGAGGAVIARAACTAGGGRGTGCGSGTA